MKILILCPVGIGDALMFTPALHLLRNRYADAQIDILTPLKGASEIFLDNPDVTTVHYHDFLGASKIESLKFVRTLRKNRYDVSINVYPQNRWEYNLITRLVGAPMRLGHTYRHQSIRQTNFLNTHRITESEERHNVVENITLLKHLDVAGDDPPPFQLHVPESATAAADDWWNRQNFEDGQMVIGMHPGSAILKNHINRRWAPERFAELGVRLAHEHQTRICVFGGPEEAPLKRQIAEAVGPAAIQVATASLLDTVACIKRCHCMVTNDSALMHFSAAVGQRTVVVLGPTNENYIYPWQTEYRLVTLPDLPCRPCFYYSPRPLTCSLVDRPYACVREITTEQVMAQVLDILHEESPPTIND
jgi:lipopolysaccharide heptosyltransferase II